MGLPHARSALAGLSTLLVLAASPVAAQSEGRGDGDHLQEEVFEQVERLCFLNDLDGDQLPLCHAPRRLARAHALAHRLARALLEAEVEVLPPPPPGRSWSGTDDDPRAERIALAALEALERPNADVDALVRGLARAGVIRSPRQGTSAEPTNPLHTAATVWFETQYDRRCDATCGGCVYANARALRLEDRFAPQALASYARHVDDRLWARGISAWSLEEAQALAFFRPITRGAIEMACGARGWGAARFRACAERFVRDQAARTVSGLAGTRDPSAHP